MHTAADMGLAQSCPSSDADDGRALYVSGLLALRDGEAEDAVTLLTQALQSQPGHAGRRRNLVRALLLAQRWEQVAMQANASLDRSPDDAELHFARGTALNALGHHAEACAAFARALLPERFCLRVLLLLHLQVQIREFCRQVGGRLTIGLNVGYRRGHAARRAEISHRANDRLDHSSHFGSSVGALRSEDHSGELRCQIKHQGDQKGEHTKLLWPAARPRTGGFVPPHQSCRR